MYCGFYPNRLSTSHLILSYGIPVNTRPLDKLFACLLIYLVRQFGDWEIHHPKSYCKGLSYIIIILSMTLVSSQSLQY